ncbi:putative stress-responsive transcriptional regulator [Thermococcus sp. 2319x1]|uniref:PspC domain-containing protein n=1 Tax=Thermococcus sp. 2319x1 TaxID=1674923 RepID=UPI00073ABF5C|nr:PspC domain-containing protein [Thermococcus sp. 2319x1]ALV62800.1 putative stress-responsive transcriptional regulator [Thermococcus sp. 2319x1]
MVEKRLKRSKKNKIFLGVLGGIAEYIDVDPTIVRVLFILLCLVEPVFILAYFLMAIVMPEEEEERVTAEKIPEKIEKLAEEAGEKVEELTKKAPKVEKKDDTKLFGIALVLLGAVLLLKVFIPLPLFGLRVIVALLILLLGLYLIARG